MVEGFLTGGNVSDMTKAGELTAEVFGCYIVEDMGYDKAMYKLRRKIEMFFGKIKEHRRVTVRYEKTDAAFLAFIALAIIKMYL